MKLSAENLFLRYGETVVFKNLSLDVNEGEILALRGGNGSGKSSLCLCLAGLMDISRGDVFFKGKIEYDGKPVTKMTIAERCAAVGIIFQNPDNQLFSTLVTEELAFAPENLAVPRDEMRQRIDEALKICGIEHLKEASTPALSGGEKQLAAIAATLTMRPKTLIADEITARIDIERKRKIRGILKDFAASGGSVVMVTHDFKDLEIATRTLELERGRDYAY